MTDTVKSMEWNRFMLMSEILGSAFAQELYFVSDVLVSDFVGLVALKLRVCLVMKTWQ